MRRVTQHFRRGELIALVVAIGWAAALAVAAFIAPLYEGGGTLVEVNGPSVAITAAVPLILSVATAVALGLRGRMARAGILAWTLTILCALFSLVALLSIGIFILPVVGCLIYACAAHGRDPAGH